MIFSLTIAAAIVSNLTVAPMFDGNTRKVVSSGRVHRAVIVAVSVVRMVQMPIHQIIDVITVRHRLVATLRTMQMAIDVSAARMIRRADHRIACIHSQRMLIHVVAVRRMKVSIVQVIDMIIVHNCRMPAVLAVHMRMIIVDLVMAHASPFILGCRARSVKSLLMP